MDMYLLHEQMAKVKAMDLEREFARDALSRDLSPLNRTRPELRRRLAMALLTLAERLDPTPTKYGSPSASGDWVRLSVRRI